MKALNFSNIHHRGRGALGVLLVGAVPVLGFSAGCGSEPPLGTGGTGVPVDFGFGPLTPTGVDIGLVQLAP